MKEPVKFRRLSTIDRRIMDAFEKAFSEEETDDGGAGSGNWGHKGRPGKRGGSGKGGGKHYRTEKKDGSGYEARKLDDPAEMAQKYMNGKRTAFQGGHGQKYMPKLKTSAPKVNHDEDNRKLYDSLKDGSNVDAYSFKHYAFKFCHPRDFSYSIGSNQLSTDDLLSAEHELVDSLETGKKYIGMHLYNVNHFIDDKQTIMKNAGRADYMVSEQYKNQDYKNLTDEEAKQFESMISDFHKQYLKRLYQWMSDKEYEEQLKPPRSMIFSQANDVIRRMCAENLTGRMSAEDCDKLADFLKLKAKMLDLPDVETDEQRKARQEEDQKRFDEEEAAHKKELEEELRKREEERKAKSAAKDAKVKAYKANAEKARANLEKATTVADVEKAVREFGFVSPDQKVDLSSIADVESAKSFVSALDSLAQKLPLSVAAIGDITGDEYRSNVYASCSMLTGQLNIGPIMKKRDSEAMQKSYQSDVIMKFHPEGTIPPGGTAAVMTHEMGHAVQGYLSAKMNINPYSHDSLSKQLRKSVMKACKLRITKDVKQNLSEYAETDSNEWFAEAFCEAYLSPNPRPIALEFRKQLEQRIKDAGIDVG